jgi:hypothetical protein
MYIISNPTMNRSIIGIMDLPEEMICTIWNNLNNVGILYSFIGVNKRFDQLLEDSIYIRSIQLTETNEYCSLPGAIIDRFYLDILPQIDQFIECLTRKSFSI